MKEISSYINLEDSNEIKLSGNESYFNMDKELTFSIASLIGKIDFNRYPENKCEELRKAYASYIGLDKCNIIASNGSDESIGMIIGANINKGKKILTLDPDFSMYDFYTNINEGILIKYKITSENKWNVDEFIAKGKKEEVSFIIFSNPNNPTGLGMSINDIEKILQEFKDIPVIVDEAYYEFYGVTALELINNYSNLVITRTLSKAWGLAALRVGFLISNKDTIEKLNAYKVPYNVNTLSQKIATEVILSQNNLEHKVDEIIKQRESLYKALKEIEAEAALDINFYKSSANFIYGETKYKDALLKALHNKGIEIRVLDGDAFRITVGSPFENKKVVEVIKDTFVY